MKTFKKSMYVVDSTNNHQKGWGRVADGAKHLSAELHLYACMPLPKLSSNDTHALRQAELELTPAPVPLRTCCSVLPRSSTGR